MQNRNRSHLQGIDVSHWQGEIDWNQVQMSGIQFAFIKATEGSHYIDPRWKENAVGAGKVGLKIGFYHFAQFRSPNEASAEALHFIKTIHSETSDLPLVLDLEVTNGLNKTELSKSAKAFLDRVQNETDHEVMLYTNTNMAQRHLTGILKEYPLWIAHYGVEKPSENGIWSQWQVFQYSSQGTVHGIKGSVDLDEMVPKLKSKVEKGYKIRKGDTFWELEERLGFPHGTLQKLNPNSDPRQLQVGMVIQMP